METIEVKERELKWENIQLFLIGILGLFTLL